MNNERQPQDVEPLEPSAALQALESGEWSQLAPDALTAHITTHYWPHDALPQGWAAGRYSRAVYLFREAATGWGVVAKFYAYKTGASAPRHAERERQRVERVRALGLADGSVRAIRPLGAWRGVLFIEHVEGLSLADLIAVRRSLPGRLLPALDRTAALLARLHVNGRQPDAAPDVAKAVSDALERVDSLEEHGVLGDEQLAAAALRRLMARWGDDPAMGRYTPALIHGDATSTNFVFPTGDPESAVVAVDWERLDVGDPAFDLGRLMAEVSHSVREQGGNGVEVAHLIEHLGDAYCCARSDDDEAAGIIERARFFRAASTLRIARNGWLSRLARMHLVVEAMGLLVR